MDRSTKIGLIGGIIVMMTILVWFFSSGSAPEKKNVYVSSDWEKEFGLFDKRPKGQFLFTSLIRAYTDHQVSVANNASDLDSLIYATKSSSTFIFIGNNFGLIDAEIEAIMDEVRKGSTFLIVYNDLTENIYSHLFYNWETTFEYAEKVEVNVENKSLEMIHLFQTDTVAQPWKVYKSMYGEYEYTTLSSIDSLANFVEMPIGEGKVLLNSTPSMFYNFQLKRTDGFKYATFVINQLPKNRDVIFVELGRLTDSYGSEIDSLGDQDGRKDDSYLRLIFENPSLLIALMLTILAMILFVLFRSKRMRPVVPFVPKKKDMTVAFAETITSIYFAKRNPYGLLHVQRKNFYASVNRHFYIDFDHVEKNVGIDSLAEKSDVSKEEIVELINLLETTKVTSVNDQYVINVHKKLQYFYNQVGIVPNKVEQTLHSRDHIFKRPMLIPSTMIFMGVCLIVIGLYNLVAAIGTGVILLPIGIFFIGLGTVLLSKPVITFSKERITHYNLFGKKKTFVKQDIIEVDPFQDGVEIRIKDQKNITINYSDVSRSDRLRLQRLLSNL